MTNTGESTENAMFTLADFEVKMFVLGSKSVILNIIQNRIYVL